MKIYIIGDIHGSYIPIKNLYEKIADSAQNQENVLILLGDVGFNYYACNPYTKNLAFKDKEFKKKLREYPFTYFMIRGNHEERALNLVKQNPKNWDTERFFGSQVLIEKEFPYIKYAMDYPEVYNILNQKTLVIPGAYSVDKFYRLERNYPWFKEEQLSSEEKKNGEILCELNNYNFDMVLSHTCPRIYQPTHLFLSAIDQSTVDISMEQYLGSIEAKIEYKWWMWGHYHKYIVYPKYNERQPIMLYNDKVIDLNKLIETNNPYESTIAISEV